MHSERREEPLERSMNPFQQRDSPKTMPNAAANCSSSAAAAGGEPTLTAASLIDAIITHQINQSPHTNEVGGGGGGGGPTGCSTSSSGVKSGVDILFNRYRRNETSPVDQRGPKERPDDSAAPPGPNPNSNPGPGSSSKVSFTLGEHIESIIAKDFHQGSVAGANEHDWERDWQRRQVDYHRSRMSNAGDPHANEYSSKSRSMDYAAKAALDYGQGRSTGESDPHRQPPISPLDYVKKKIVEVMRTSSDGAGMNHDMAPPSSPARRGISPAPSPSKRSRLNADVDQDRGGPSPVVPQYLSAPYPAMNYPFSMPPNVPISSNAAANAVAAAAAAAAATSTSSISAGNQPVVVLSSQYEALSDED